MSSQHDAQGPVAPGELFLVNASVERSVSFWVRAATRADADEAAVNLVETLDEEDWDQDDSDVDVIPASRIMRTPGPDDLIWSGGPEGAWE